MADNSAHARVMERLLDLVTLMTRVVVIAVGSLLVLVVSGEMFVRYVFNNSFFFADELARYLFIWVAFLGASLALRRGQHVGLELIIHRRSRALRVLVQVLVGAFLIVFLVSSLTLLPAMWQQHTTTLGIRMFWVYLALPVGAVLMLLQLVPLIRQAAEGRLPPDQSAPLY